MAGGPIPDTGKLVDEMRRLGFEPTQAQIRFLETDCAHALSKYGGELGARMRTGADALRRAGNQYGKALFAEINRLQRS